MDDKVIERAFCAAWAHLIDIDCDFAHLTISREDLKSTIKVALETLHLNDDLGNGLFVSKRIEDTINNEMLPPKIGTMVLHIDKSQN